MSRRIDIRQIAVVLVAVVVLAAAAIPACQVAVCGMGSPVHPEGGLAALCTMPMTGGATPAAAGSSLLSTLSLVLLIVLGVAASTSAAVVRSRVYEFDEGGSPPSPHGMRGVRLII